MVSRMAVGEALRFDPSEPEFLQNPYPTLNRLREAARVFYDEERERWFVARHEDVRGCLRDKRLGRNFRHLMAPEEIGVPPLDARWRAFLLLRSMGWPRCCPRRQLNGKRSKAHYNPN